MAQIPRYTRQNITLPQPIQLQRPSGTQRSAMLVNEIGRMQQFVEGRLREERIKEGQQAVNEYGALSVLNQISEKGGPTSIAERSAWELANQVGADRLESEARLEMQRIYDDARKDNVDYQIVNQQILDVVDGFSSSLSSFDPTAAATLQQRLENIGSGYDQNYLNYWGTLQTDAELARQEILYNQQLTDLVVDIENNGLYRSEDYEHLNGFIGRMYIDPDNQIRLQAQVDTEIEKAQIKYNIFSNPELVTYESREDAIEDLYGQENLLTALGPSDRETFIASLRTENNRLYRYNADNFRNKLLQSQNEELLYGGVSTNRPPEAELRTYLTAEQYYSEIGRRRAIDNAPNRHLLSDNELRQNTRSAQERALQLTGNIEEDMIRRNEYESSESMNNQIIAQRLADPIGYFNVHNTNVRTALSNLENVFGNPDTELVQNTFNAYLTEIEAQYDSLDIPIEDRKIFTTAFASGIVSTLNGSIPSDELEVTPGIDPSRSLTSDQKKALVQGILDVGDDNIQVRIINELELAGLESAYIRFMEIPAEHPDRVNAQEQLIQASNLNIESILPDATQRNGITDTIRDRTESHFEAMLAGTGDPGLITEQYNELVDLTATITGRILAQNRNASEADAINTALSYVMHESVVSNALIPFDFTKVMPVETIESIFQYLKSPEASSTFNIDPVPLGYDAETELEVMKNAIDSNAVFINNATGDGVYLAYPNLENNLIIPVLDTGQNEIEFKFSELSNYLQQGLAFIEQRAIREERFRVVGE